MEIKTKKFIDVSDWDNLVQKTYDKIYSFQQQDGCKPRGIHHIEVPMKNPYDYENDTIPEIFNSGEHYGVSFKAWLARDPEAVLNPTDEQLNNSNYYWGKTEKDAKRWKESKSHITLFWQRNFYPSVDMIINDLHKKGLLEEGEYVIDIDW